MEMFLRFRRVLDVFAPHHLHQRHDDHADVMVDVAHELQTPLAILRGNFEVLRRSDTDEPARMLAERVIASTLEGMTRLVNDSLASAKLRSPERALATGNISVKLLLDEVVEDCAILAEDKDVALLMSGGSRMTVNDIFICGDRDKLKEVLFNLISNAFKHTPPGGAVTLGVERAKTVARITVEDTGTGIASAELPHIFERFYRIRDGNDGVPGTGLGLNICRAIVEAHGGHIGAEGEPGKGSRFTITLPLASLPLRARDAGASEGAIAAARGSAAVSAIINP